MAARTNRIVHDDNTRAKIKTSQLVNRLQAHILGEIELSASQVRGIEILLNRTLPVLQSIEHTGEQQTGLSELLQLAARQAAALEKAQDIAKSRSTRQPDDVQGEISRTQYQPTTKPN